MKKDKNLYIIAGCNGALNGKHFPASMILRLYGLSSSSKESREES